MKEDNIERLYHVQVSTDQDIFPNEDELNLEIKFLDGPLEGIRVESRLSIEDIKNED